MPPKEKKEKHGPTHDELIAQAAKQYEGKEPFQVTNYGGAEINKDQAKQLKDQPAAELLNFTEIGDKVILQAKLPEMGYAEGLGPFKIRENMNYFARGMVKAVMNPDGSLNTEKVRDLEDLRYDLQILANDTRKSMITKI